MSAYTIALLALGHIAAGHDVVCCHCGYAAKAKSKDKNVCPSCKSVKIAYGADEIAAYALRQIGGGGE